MAGLRGLGISGVAVTALAPSWSGAGLWSRFATDRTVGPDPGRDPAGFADEVGRVSAARGAMVVYPGREEAIEALLDHWDTLPRGVVMPYPWPAPLRAIRDKTRLPELAGAAGIPTPATRTVAAAEALAASPPEFPCIVKPGDPVGRLKSAHLVRGPDELDSLLRRRRVPPDERVLVQEWARGPVLSLEVVLGRRGEVVGRFQQRTERTWPVAAGSIAFGTSVRADEELVRRAARMLRDAGYWGLAQLDFVATVEGPVLVDVNPRFYSCLPLAIACGVNLPAAWHAVALGGGARCPEAYPTGVSFRWLEGDLVAAARGSPKRLLRRAPPPRTGSMWAWHDPLPGIVLAIGVVGSRVRRTIRRLLRT